MVTIGHTAGSSIDLTGYDATSGVAMAAGGLPLVLGTRGGQEQAFGEGVLEVAVARSPEPVRTRLRPRPTSPGGTAARLAGLALAAVAVRAGRR